MGKGANADILYLETVFSIDELDTITLISNIPGSETWDVRDLFQRDVDDDRVQKDIIPYYKDETKIKFFSPITLILLPTANSKSKIVKDIEYIEPVILDDTDIEKFYEKKNVYKLNIYRHPEPIAKLEWNDRNTFLVAIDGQHRLSGLKQWKSEPRTNIQDWKIPVVILNIFKVDENISTANLLEIVRKTFVYINTKAERINRAREILLNDESVNSICTQEVIQRSHDNDVLPYNERDDSIIPLIFFDWQGKVVNKKQFPGPASVKSVEEIYLWFEEYIFEEDGSDLQKSELCLGDLVPSLEGYGPKSALSHKDAERIRSQFRKIALKGLSYLLENFTPYKSYIKACRTIENKAIEKSINASHAFMKLRFGSHNAPEDQNAAVEAEFISLIETFDDLKKKKIDFSLRQDLGMRGIIYTFFKCKEHVIDFEERNIEWLDFSEVFTEIIDEIYNQKWFKPFDELKAKQRSFLTFLIFDPVGKIINYRFSQAKDALGSLLVILVFDLFRRKSIFNNNSDRFKENSDRFEEIWGEYSNNLKKTYEKGFRNLIKAEKADSWQGSIPDFSKYVKDEAEKQSTKKIRELYKFVTK